MLKIVLTLNNARRSWIPFRRRAFVLNLPEMWSEVQPLARRQRWWRWIISLPGPAAQRAMLRDLLPLRYRRRLRPMEFAALAHHLAWTAPDMQCEQVPIPHFTHAGRMYYFPTPKGENTTCLEYAIADDYYKEFAAGDTEALFRLSATLWRERDTDSAATLRRGDKRVLLNDKAEIEHRVRVLREAPADFHLQALYFFAGLKQYVHRIYGTWLFEPTDDDDDADDEAVRPTNNGPDFGWWGVFQQVASEGVFGHDVRLVYQAALHEVCVHLVRRRVEAQRMGSTQTPAPAARPENED